MVEENRPVFQVSWIFRHLKEGYSQLHQNVFSEKNTDVFSSVDHPLWPANSNSRRETHDTTSRWSDSRQHPRRKIDYSTKNICAWPISGRTDIDDLPKRLPFKLMFSLRTQKHVMLLNTAFVSWKILSGKHPRLSSLSHNGVLRHNPLLLWASPPNRIGVIEMDQHKIIWFIGISTDRISNQWVRNQGHVPMR